MRIVFCSSLLAFVLVGVTHAQFEYYEWPDPEESVVTDTENDLWPVSNLIQGPGAGFDAEAPNEQPGGGQDSRWVTADDAGFPSDYIEDVRQPVLQFDLGADVPLKEISVWGYSGTNSNGTSQFSLRFATEAEGGTDGLFDADIEYGQSISYNPTFELFSDPAPQQIKLFDEHVTARYVEFTNLDNFFIAPGDGTEPPEEPLERLLPVLPGGDRVGLGEVAFMKLPDTFMPGDLLPQSIGGDEFGTFEIAAQQSGQQFGPPSEPEPGLLQEWYAVENPANKAGIDALAAANPTAVPPFRAESGITWWSGSNDVPDVPKYPSEIEGVLAGDAENYDQYTVRLTGELLIEESGTISFLDGVDDFTYLAIDTDRSGTAGDSDAEILINDNNWTDALSAGNGGAPIVEADFENIEEGGEWLAIEFNMAEGGGGDSGMLYWDAMDEDGFFPLDQGEGVFDQDAAVFMIPDSHLRSSIKELIGANASGDLATAYQADVTELNIQVGPDGNDQIVLQDLTEGEGIGTLDVSGTTIRIVPSGTIEDGAEFQIFAADEVVGIDEMTLFAEGFDTSRLGEGILVFGTATDLCNPDSGGDINGDGSVGFPDFLILSDNFGTNVSGAGHQQGDLDCNGEVAFADFLVLSNNFGNTAAAGTSSVPEPSAFALFGVAGLFVGMLRRRRS